MKIWPDPARAALRLSVLQFAPALREPETNRNTIERLLADVETDLAVTPELSLTGYDLRDATADAARRMPDRMATRMPVVAGGVESANGGLLYNVAVLGSADGLQVLHRKVYLPTYGMFDEGRYFARGNRVQPFEIDGWRIGVLICEDFWHPALAYLLAMQGIHVLLVLAAAPGRGALQGGEEDGFFASSDSWERIARTTAQLYGIYVAVCNRCGVEGGVTFAGESVVVAPDTSVLARAGVEEQRLDVTLERTELIRLRRPYAHLRDDDTRFVAAELARISTHD